MEMIYPCLIIEVDPDCLAHLLGGGKELPAALVQLTALAGGQGPRPVDHLGSQCPHLNSILYNYILNSIVFNGHGDMLVMYKYICKSTLKGYFFYFSL